MRQERIANRTQTKRHKPRLPRKTRMMSPRTVTPIVILKILTVTKTEINVNLSKRKRKRKRQEKRLVLTALQRRLRRRNNYRSCSGLKILRCTTWMLICKMIRSTRQTSRTLSWLNSVSSDVARSSGRPYSSFSTCSSISI